jgi:hypothetical protein
MIVELDQNQETELIEYLCTEAEAAESERGGKKQKWAKWRRQREVQPEHDVKTYPLGDDSSNVSVPLAAINANTAFGHLISTFNVRRPFWTIEAQRDDPQERELAKFGTKYMNMLAKSESDLDFKKRRRVILNETGVMGHTFVKVLWTEHRNWYKDNAVESGPGDEGVSQLFESVTHVGPEIISMPLENFLYREAFQDIQRAPWVAHIVPKARHELEDSMAGEWPHYENVEQVLAHADDNPQDYQQEIDRRRGVSQRGIERFLLHEFWVYYDADGDGIAEDLVITVHLKSRQILKARYNSLGYRPFVNFVHLLRPFYMDGMGTGWMSEQMQDEVDTGHNLRWDNQKQAVNRMWAVRRNSGITGNERIFPGKMFMVSDPGRDIVPLAQPDVTQSTFTSENMSIMYAQKANALPDVMAGFANQVLKTRDSVGGQQMRLQQSQGVFSAITEGITESFSRVGRLVFMSLVQNREAVLEREQKLQRLTEKELKLLDELLLIPPNEVYDRLTFSVQTTDIEKTYESRRQNMLSLTQLYSMFLKETTPLAMQLFGPKGQQMKQQAPELYDHLMQVYTGSCRLMEKIFEFFNEEDTQDYIPDYERQEAIWEYQMAMMNQLRQMQMMRAQQGGNRGTSIPAGVQQPGTPGATSGAQGAGGAAGEPTGPAQEQGMAGENQYL